MKIYTRTGDKGETSLFSGQRISKCDPFIEALGTIDECNSVLGTAKSFLPEAENFNIIRNQIEIIQHALFDLGAAVATPRTSSEANKIDKTRFDQDAIQVLEKWIDEMDAQLPPLKTFILPSGHPAASFTHLARSVCRRAERTVIPLNKHADVADAIVIYLNRLSDYLFILARFINKQANASETLWQHHKQNN